MYKIFINDKPLFLTDDDSNYPASETRVLIHFHSVDDLASGIRALEEQNHLESLMLIGPDLDKLWRAFTAKYMSITAAGGLVKNSATQYLLIFRNGKWDLPKGKLENSETPDVAALREVEEECGITNISLGIELPNTYHTYRMGGKNILKRTHWYVMDYSGNETPTPQLEEGIEKVEWMDLEQILEARTNTYASINDILSTLD